MARFSFLFVALALASMHGALGAPSCKPKGHGHLKHSVISYSPSTSLPTYPANIPKESGVSESKSSTPTPSPTSSPAVQPEPSSTPSATPSPSQPASSGSSGGSVSDADIATYLKAHNDFRAKHGAQPLTWSNELSNTAQSWANGCKFEHSHGKFGGTYRLFGGGFLLKARVQKTFLLAPPFRLRVPSSCGRMKPVRRSYPGLDMTFVLISKCYIGEYDPNNPTYSHFTQVVWKSTTQLGCAVANCGAGTVFPSSVRPNSFALTVR